MKYLRVISLLIGLGLLVSSSALPDIVNVGVDYSVSGSGTVTGECPGPEPGCVLMSPASIYTETASYNFSGATSQIGALTVDGTATATSCDCGATGFGQVDEFVTANSKTMALSLDGFHGANDALSYSGSENADLQANFDLTVPSMMLLTTTAFSDNGPSSYSGQLLDSQGNVILIPPFAFSTSSMFLPAGAYSWDISVASGGSGGVTVQAIQTDFNLGLNADFTPVATPEPRWALIGALIAAMLAGWAVSNRRGAGVRRLKSYRYHLEKPNPVTWDLSMERKCCKDFCF